MPKFLFSEETKGNYAFCDLSVLNLLTVNGSTATYQSQVFSVYFLCAGFFFFLQMFSRKGFELSRYIKIYILEVWFNACHPADCSCTFTVNLSTILQITLAERQPSVLNPSNNSNLTGVL